MPPPAQEAIRKMQAALCEIGDRGRGPQRALLQADLIGEASLS